MGSPQMEPKGPDLALGVSTQALKGANPLLGHVDGEPVLLAQSRDQIFAVGATCTHYGGPLGDGLLVGETVRCPWHHACFSLCTGEALRAPALNPIACWRVERDGETVRVREKLPDASKTVRPKSLKSPRAIVILGGGGAGHCAAETLRREGYDGPVTLISADDSPPCDRPNLSKDYLAGSAPEDWIPLRSKDFYRDERIDLRLDCRATNIDAKSRTIALANRESVSYEMLLVATGAEPVRLPVPGAELPHVHYLRSLADSRAIIKAASSARSAVVIGASFIGLEVAASLRARKLDVDVVAPEKIPMERILGAEIGSVVRSIHEDHGVRFHLGATVAAIGKSHVALSTGEKLAAELVVVGIGVRPATALAETAGIAADRGIVVNEYLETSVRGIFAAGDLARWPDPHTGEKIRVEHWVVAERQGQSAARNMLGRKERFEAVPFFWSVHYDNSILYVGHAERWDRIEIDGDAAKMDCQVTYRRGGRALAVATIGRDLASLQAEFALEQDRSMPAK